MKSGGSSGTRKMRGSDVFFPAAALYAALAVPLAVYAMTGAAWPPGLIAGGHAHEILFGFALALIAGYLLGPTDPRRLAWLLALWGLARVSHALAPASPAASISSPLFALALAVCLIPKFRAAKKWRNRAVVPLLLALCLLPLGYAAAMHLRRPGAAYELLPAGVLLLALLMAFMGGRVIAPAAAGAFYRRGMNLEHRVQPRLEAAVILLLGAAAVLLLLPHGRTVAGAAAMAGGIVLSVRLFRWRLWVVREQRDLMVLAAGYGWLIVGLLLLGGALASGGNVIPALHVIAVGALGTLSISVMTRVHLQHTGRDPSQAPLVSVSVGFIAAAALLRLAAGPGMEFRHPMLWLAAASWSLAYLMTAVLLLRTVRGGRRRVKP